MRRTLAQTRSQTIIPLDPRPVTSGSTTSTRAPQALSQSRSALEPQALQAPEPQALHTPEPRHPSTRTRSARKRKAQVDKIPARVGEYLDTTAPTQWSFDHLREFMKAGKVGAKIKWALKAKLDEIVNSGTGVAGGGGLGYLGAERYKAARRLLQEINSHKPFSTPAATFRLVNSGAGSTVIYAHNSTVNTSIPPAQASASTHVTPPPNDPTPVVSCHGRSPTDSDTSHAEYGPSDITFFLTLYPSLRTRFELKTAKRSITLEEILYDYITNKNHENEVKNDLLLRAGFMDLAKEPKLVSKEELGIIKAALVVGGNKDQVYHDIVACVKKCFKECLKFEEFARARDVFSCAVCKYTPLFEQAASAVLYTIHLLDNDINSTQPLEGNFDIIWGHIIDRAFITHHGILHRKEKTSPLSPYKFDGLFLSDGIIPQEWVVLEVARSSGSGTKQTCDRQKLVQHCIRILNHRRWHLSAKTNLQGRDLMRELGRFPVWGILCQGWTIEIVKLTWLTRGVGLVTTFVSKYPKHMAKLENLYRILEQVHTAVESVKISVDAWDKIHEQMEGH